MVGKFKKKLFAFVTNLVVGSSFITSGFLGFNPKDDGYSGYIIRSRYGSSAKSFGDVVRFPREGWHIAASADDSGNRYRALLHALTNVAKLHYFSESQMVHSLHKENGYAKTCLEFFGDIVDSANGSFEYQLNVIKQKREEHFGCGVCKDITYAAEHLLNLAYRKYSNVSDPIYRNEDLFYKELERQLRKDFNYKFVIEKIFLSEMYQCKNRSESSNEATYTKLTDKLEQESALEYLNSYFKLTEAKAKSKILETRYNELLTKFNEIRSEENSNFKNNNTQNKVKKNKNEQKNKKKNINSMEEEKKEEDLNKEEYKNESLDEILNKLQDYIKPENKGWTRIIDGKKVYIGNAENRHDYEGAKANPEVTTLEKLKVNNLVSDEDSEEIRLQMDPNEILNHARAIRSGNMNRLSDNFLIWAGDQLSGIHVSDGYTLKEAPYTVLYDEENPHSNHIIGGLKQGYKSILDGGIYFINYLSDGKRLVTYYDLANLEKPRLFLSMDHYNPNSNWYEIVG